MLRVVRPASAAALLLWILSSSACSPHRMPTDPGGPAGRAEALSNALVAGDLAPVDPALRAAPRRPSGSPPSVRITSPPPSALLTAYVPPHTTVSWECQDPDGPGHEPRSYFYRIFSEGGADFDFQLAITHPDTLRAFYAPRFEGWTELKGSVGSITLPDLEPWRRQLFVITAVDRRGNDDPVYSLTKNMLLFVIQPSATGETAGTAGGSHDPLPGDRSRGH